MGECRRKEFGRGKELEKREGREKRVRATFGMNARSGTVGRELGKDAHRPAVVRERLGGNEKTRLSIAVWEQGPIV